MYIVQYRRRYSNLIKQYNLVDVQLLGVEVSTELCLFDGPEGGTLGPFGKKPKSRPLNLKLVIFCPTTFPTGNGESGFIGIWQIIKLEGPKRAAEAQVTMRRMEIRRRDFAVADEDEEDTIGGGRICLMCVRSGKMLLSK